MVVCSLMVTHSESSEKGVNPEEERFSMWTPHEVSIENLQPEEKQIYHQLGPLYQRIYLDAFNDEERHRVVVYVRRGLSVFDAMNTLLRADERQYIQKQNPKNNNSVVPSERSSGSTPSRSIF